MSYYHPAILDFLQEKGETLLKGLDGHEEKNDPNRHPFMVSCLVLTELRNNILTNFCDVENCV